MGKPKIPDSVEVWIVQLYLQGMSTPAIQKLTGVNNSTVGRILTRRNIPKRRTAPRGLELKERFERRVVRGTGDECWKWKGGKYRGGYGQLSVVVDGRKTCMPAHCLSYRLHIGEIPKGLLVCHKCDNPECTNPGHLFLGTILDNNRDREAKGRGADIRGAKNPMAKITEQDVLKIRELSSQGLSATKIGKLYGLSRSSAQRIVNREAWKHI